VGGLPGQRLHDAPRACCDEGKRAAETLASDYARQFAVDTRIARIFNTHGPRMCADGVRVVSNFFVQALRGEPTTVYGGGTQTRSCSYVDDPVDGLLRLMDAPAAPDPVNLGNPEVVTVLELARHIIALVGRSEVVQRPLPEDDPSRRCPDITRARAMLGWQPRVSLDEGLRRSLPAFVAATTNPGR